jgi:L-amino acid N-acyltransferase YncA
MSVSIRPARVSDAVAIAAIYNEGIEDREATFETEPRTEADLVDALADPVAPPFLVAETGAGVVGWARLSQYSPRPCYAGVGEASIYIERGSRNRGLGQRLFEALAEVAERRGYWKITGLLFPTNRASVALCRASGCREVGVFRRHGRLDGRWRDVLQVERLLGEAGAAAR